MKFNINQFVKVKLTDFGRKIHKQKFDDLIKSNPALSNFIQYVPPVEEDGWSSFQLWEVMSIFGQHMTNGGDLVFEIEIDIPLGAKLP